MASIVVRMPAALHAAVKAKAAQEGRSMAETMRRALRLYVATERTVDLHGGRLRLRLSCGHVIDHFPLGTDAWCSTCVDWVHLP